MRLDDKEGLNEGVADPDTVELVETDVEQEMVGELEGDAVAVGEGDTEPVLDTLGECDPAVVAVNEGEVLPLGDDEAVTDGVVDEVPTQGQVASSLIQEGGKRTACAQMRTF